MTHPLIEKAAQHLAQARAINDEFEGKDMPAEADATQDRHLAEAGTYLVRAGTDYLRIAAGAKGGNDATD